MRCLFCKSDSRNSRSSEHIIPESMGNTTQILPPGLVCDSCNAYFAKEVEKPFLSLEEISNCRAAQFVPNKRGRVPPQAVRISPTNEPAIFRRHRDGILKSHIEMSPGAFEQLLTQQHGTISFQLDPIGLPSGAIVARFLGKCALETLAQRVFQTMKSIDCLIEDAVLDPIRNLARRGMTTPWETNIRRIYPSNAKWQSAHGEPQQVIHESDFLESDAGEAYYVLAYFGLEMAINLLNPKILGYKIWLKEHLNESPLHCGKNTFNSGLRRVGDSAWPYAPSGEIRKGSQFQR